MRERKLEVNAIGTDDAGPVGESPEEQSQSHVEPSVLGDGQQGCEVRERSSARPTSSHATPRHRVTGTRPQDDLKGAPSLYI